MFLRKAFAFFWRDLLLAASYKLAFVKQLAGMLISALSLYFLSRMFNQAKPSFLEPYGGDYFAFVLIGIAFASYTTFSLRAFSSAISAAQSSGTLEVLLTTQTGLPTIVLSSSLYSFLLTSFNMFLYCVVGVLFFGVDMSHANFAAGLVILFLTVLSLGSIGILSASFIVVFKQGDPFTWLFSIAFWLLGGVVYPTTVLPDWLQSVSALIPFTSSLSAMRNAILQGHSLRMLTPDVMMLSLFALVMLPTSLFIFKRAIHRAKINGTLTHY